LFIELKIPVASSDCSRFWKEFSLRKQASKIFRICAVGLVLVSQLTNSVQALELDWSGQFWSEFNFISNYSMDNTDQGAAVDPTRVAGGGYYIPGGGSKDVNFFTLFLRLRPKLIVNDNIYIKSELWFGNPTFGFFGDSVPYTFDQRQFYSSQSRGSSVSAQRFWGEFLTDIGTFQAGRVPLQWGLGVVWNPGENLWDRYVSTGDAVRWIAKFGSFSFIPSLLVPSIGNTLGGSCIVAANGTCTPGVGTGRVVDYSFILKYENTEDELEGGINLIRRLAGAGQDVSSGYLTPQSTSPTAGGFNYVTYDLYAKKKFNRISLAAEVPFTSGNLAGASYNSVGIAGEANWKPTDVYDFLLKAGYASGQGNLGSNTLGDFKAFYFNPNYHIAMIMFNYQLANFSRPQSLNSPNLNVQELRSPYDNPIVNATYASLSSNIKPWDKWNIRPALIYAVAPQTAAAGQFFYNYWTRGVSSAPAIKNQGSRIGFEADLGITFQWDEYLLFSWDNGLFLPGDFFAFSNAPTDNRTDTVFATSFRVGVSF
jgi:hypothetical protein